MKGCDECKNESTCVVCNASLGYRLSGNVCTTCKNSCATCESTDLSLCLSCDKPKYLLNNVCYDECPTGYFKGFDY